jgi:flavin reductase (DIM6/NTAB) family NADH-FMN oxidoreductase RutF
MSDLKEIRPEDISGNVFDLIGKKWMLITASSESGFNTMTASWGGMGVLWGKPVAFCFVRPQRYTYKFMERSGYYSLSFYDEAYRSALELCGTKSGRDCDKVKESGLTPVFGGESIYFEQSNLVLICKKLFADDFRPANFIDSSIELNYPGKDYHRAYIGEIVRVLSK